MTILKVKWVGVRPLIMHSAAMIDPDNAFVRQIDKLKKTLKQKKKDDFEGKEEVRRQIERAEWEGAMYWNSNDGLFLPGDNIFACIIAGARKSKCGKQAEQAIIPISDTPITTKSKTKNLDTMYSDPEFQLRYAVRIPPKTGARIMKVRPMAPTGWNLAFNVEYDKDILPTEDLKEAITNAGVLYGVGDWRPKFGRFNVEFL